MQQSTVTLDSDLYRGEPATRNGPSGLCEPGQFDAETGGFRRQRGLEIPIAARDEDPSWSRGVVCRRVVIVHRRKQALGDQPIRKGVQNNGQ